MKKVIGIYLAAGNSRRMGKCKLSLPLPINPLGTIALNQIIHSNIDYLLIITKDLHSEWLESAEELRSFKNKWENIICLKAHLGQSYSLRTGILRAKQLGADSIIVFLADQPLITIKMINNLIDESNDELEYVASTDGQVVMPPILFNEKTFDELLTIDGDKGARSLLKKGAFTGTYIYTCSEHLLDIDTIDEYQYVKSHYLL